MRIASLFPAGTEIAFAIGAGDDVVAVSHACNHPPQVAELDIVTAARFDPSELSSRDIYKQKVEINKRFGSLFRLDETRLWKARADVLITQGPGDFSLVSLQAVRAIAEGLNPRPNLVILYPRHLDEVLDDHAKLGFEVGRFQEARELTAELRRRIQLIETRAATLRRPKVAVIQWLAPGFSGGYWIPQLVEIAGGEDLLNSAGLPPNRYHWQDIRRLNPDVIVVAVDDMEIERVRREMFLLTDRPGWWALNAVVSDRVYLGDGYAFNRPGPRLIDALEALAWALHPEEFAEPPEDLLVRFGR